MSEVAGSTSVIPVLHMLSASEDREASKRALDLLGTLYSPVLAGFYGQCLDAILEYDNDHRRR